jgi:multiple sugar transport system substrate-binding protein
VLAGDIPDVVINWAGQFQKVIELGLAYDITEMVNKYKFDLKTIDPNIQKSIMTGTAGSGFEGLIGIGIYDNPFALFYNKALFDRRGIPYPTDNLYWDETITIAKRMSFTENGIKYYGLDPDSIGRAAFQLELPFADFTNHKAVFTSHWKESYQLWLDIRKASGSDTGAVARKGNLVAEFMKGEVAMMASGTHVLPQLETAEMSGLRWDVVSYPQNRKKPGYQQRTGGTVVSITKLSKHKDAAFQLIRVLLSPEVQTMISRNGKMAALKDRTIQNQYGADVKQLQGKNGAVFTKLKMSAVQPQNYLILNWSPVSSALNNALYDMLAGKDINTALREADEKTQKVIDEVRPK